MQQQPPPQDPRPRRTTNPLVAVLALVIAVPVGLLGLLAVFFALSSIGIIDVNVVDILNDISPAIQNDTPTDDTPQDTPQSEPEAAPPADAEDDMEAFEEEAADADADAEPVVESVAVVGDESIRSINGVDIAPDGRALVVITQYDSDSSVVRRYDLRSRETDDLRTNDVVYSDVRYRPGEDQIMLVAAEDNVVELFDVERNQTIHSFTGYTLGAFSPDGELIALVTEDQNIEIWDPDYRRVETTLDFGPTVESIALSGDNQWLYIGHEMLDAYVVTRMDMRDGTMHRQQEDIPRLRRVETTANGLLFIIGDTITLVFDTEDDPDGSLLQTINVGGSQFSLSRGQYAGTTFATAFAAAWYVERVVRDVIVSRDQPAIWRELETIELSGDDMVGGIAVYDDMLYVISKTGILMTYDFE